MAILMPLWASYLVKVYAWRIILQDNGPLNWLLEPFGLTGPGFGNVAGVIVFSYLWLPYMILPLYAGLERIPDSLLEASSDLGGKAGRTFRRVILPLAFPALVAGSIFTFSLTLGDFIAPQIVMAGNQFIGNVVYANVGVANNLPLAAAFATVPVAVMVVYLCSHGARERSTRCDARARREVAAACRHGADARVRLHADRRDRALRLQREPHPGVADQGLDARVVRPRAAQPGRARRADALGQGGARRDTPRARARHARVPCRCALPLLRPRDDLVPRHPPDRVARDRDRDGAQRDLQHGGRHSSACSRSSSGTRPSASSSSTTTRSRGCGGRRSTSRRPPPTSEPTPGRPSAT